MAVKKKKRGGPKQAKAAAAAAAEGHEDLALLVDRLAARFAVGPARASNGSTAAPPAALVEAQSMELSTLLGQLRQRLSGLRTAAGTALEHFGADGTAEADDAALGSSGYMEMKVQLLLSYLICLVYYLLLKVRGVPVRDHPVVQRLLWLRTLLEKLRPVDQRLQYQIGKLLQLGEGRAAGGSEAGTAAATASAHALRPGELAVGVGDEDGDAAEADNAAGVYADPQASDGVYRPPRIAQMEYTGDHVSMKERAEKDLARKEGRLQRSDFMRSLREEFTDAPAEIHGSQKSAKAEKAARLMAEQTSYEEDMMIRMRTSKKELRTQSKLIREGRATGSGVASLDELTTDFNDMVRTARPGRRGGRNGASALDEYQAASKRARDARGVVSSTLDGPSGKGKGKGKGKGGGGGGGPAGKRRRR